MSYIQQLKVLQLTARIVLNIAMCNDEHAVSYVQARFRYDATNVVSYSYHLNAICIDVISLTILMQNVNSYLEDEYPKTWRSTFSSLLRLYDSSIVADNPLALIN